MQPPRARPRFALDRPESADAIVARVQAYLDGHPGPIGGTVFRRTVVLTFDAAHRQLWTPQLDLQVSERPDGGAHLQGTLAPHPRLWTLFVGVQFVFALAALSAAIFLGVKWSLGQDLLGSAIVLVATLVGGGLAFGAAYVGQGIGSEQMYELRAFLDAALREPSPAGPVG
ncbi:MAG: hypothetical protein R3B06_24705 [Kofleriaceae bacterium]